jgi:hypothetical protein
MDIISTLDFEEAGRSHNRDTEKSFEHAINSQGQYKICKCPLHYNKGKGTKVSLTKFKRHSISGVQGMCAEGKTLIDSYSHQLKRLQLYFICFPNQINIAFKTIPKKYNYIIDKIIEITNSVLTIKNSKKLSPINFQLYKITLLDEKLKTKATGFYEADLSIDDKYNFNAILINFFNEDTKQKIDEIQNSWTIGCYVKDSKDGKLYPVDEFPFNFSKKRELYDSNKKLTPYRINVHNTRAKGQRSSTLRGEKYLADGHYTEANRMMKEIGNRNKLIHADHIIPLALGGIHDVKNLQKLTRTENIYKKDKLTLQAFELLLEDINYLSKWHHPVFIEYINQPIEIIEQALKKSVLDFRNKIKKMSIKKKKTFIQNVYKNYKESQIDRIIKKHFM